MKTKIEFYDTSELIDQKYHPVPAAKRIPEWYKKTRSYRNDEKYVNPALNPQDSTNSSVKKCVPVFDALTAGYLIINPVDIIVRWDKESNSSYFQWSDSPGVGFQAHWQADNYPTNRKHKNDFPKFGNTWSIKTPFGYSVYITSPIHHDLPFKTLEGVVDTDTYVNPILFPFVLKEEKWEGVISAGTPIAQVIPFKRQSWVHEIVTGEKAREQYLKNEKLLHSMMVDAYKNLFWRRKQYR